MKTHVSRWGNSLAVRIPRAFAAELGLDHETPVELSVEHGAVVLRPIRAPEYRLDDLLDGVTRKNLHEEQDFGPATGGEAW